MKETYTTLPIILSTILVILKKANITYKEYIFPCDNVHCDCDSESYSSRSRLYVMVEQVWVPWDTADTNTAPSCMS